MNTELPVRTVQEFIKHAKEPPGKIACATGNSEMLVAAQLRKTQAGKLGQGVRSGAGSTAA